MRPVAGVSLPGPLYGPCTAAVRYVGTDCDAFLEFLPTVGLAMVVNLRRGYPDTVLAEKFLVALL
jgi:hypothetical protein